MGFYKRVMHTAARSWRSCSVWGAGMGDCLGRIGQVSIGGVAQKMGHLATLSATQKMGHLVTVNPTQLNTARHMTTCIRQTTTRSLFSPFNNPSPLLSVSPSVLVTQTAGIKHVGIPKLRCRHCYFVVKDEVKYVMCTSKPRHYQAQKNIALKYGNMIMTHATQGSSKSNNGKGSRHMRTQQSCRMEF